MTMSTSQAVFRPGAADSLRSSSNQVISYRLPRVLCTEYYYYANSQHLCRYINHDRAVLRIRRAETTMDGRLTMSWLRKSEVGGNGRQWRNCAARVNGPAVCVPRRVSDCMQYAIRVVWPSNAKTPSQPLDGAKWTATSLFPPRAGVAGMVGIAGIAGGLPWWHRATLQTALFTSSLEQPKPVPGDLENLLRNRYSLPSKQCLAWSGVRSSDS